MGPARTGVVRTGAGGSGGEVEDQQASGGAETGGDNGGGAGRGAAGHPVGGVEGAADIEAAATHGHVLDPGVGPALEGGDPGAIAEAQLGQALLGDPVDPGEAAAGERVQAVGAAASDSTWASTTGANAVSVAPVVVSKAKMLLRGMAVVGASVLATWVN
jgi:hypothetical protein